jgi:hypothetical protein
MLVNSKKLENDSSKAPKRKKNTKKQLTFPWWFKIIAYLLSYTIAVVSIVFIIFYGISFGDEKCSKWLTSFVFSAMSSCFIIQPIEV